MTRFSVRPHTGKKQRRNYAKGGEVEDDDTEVKEENLNPWEAEGMFESWENDPGIQGHMDPRSEEIMDPGHAVEDKPYKTPIIEAPGHRRKGKA